MDSQIIKIVKNIVVLTLIVGFLLMPVATILAEETLAPAPSAPIVLDTIPEPASIVVAPALVIEPSLSTSTSTPIESEVATNTCPVFEFVGTSTDPMPVVADPVIAPTVIDSPDQKALTIDLVGEDSFTTSDETPVDNSLVTVSEEQDFTTLVGEIAVPDNMAISEENPFGDDVVVTVDPAISNEGQWETLPEEGVITPSISEENSFTTASLPDDNHTTISTEQSFYTLGVPSDDLAISAEQSFVTLSTPTDDVTISDEGSFTTLNGGDHTDPSVSTEQSFTTLGGSDNPTVSEEMSFTTLGGSDNPTVSEEMSFTTLDTPGNPDGGENSFTTLSGSSGCTSNCGGGGGGGGGQVLAEKVYRCEILLYKFIRLGQVNDRREVIKLQAFLKVYEGFKNLKLTGVYDMPTYRAVEIFQKRYGKDILGPWKISDSTGYVYITTRIAINNIFCGRDTTNNMDLRDEFYREYQAATGETFTPNVNITPIATSTDVGYFITSTTNATSTSVVKKSWILASLGGLFGFVGDNLCWLLNLFLLLIILFLLWLLWLADRDEEEVPDSIVVGGASSVDSMGLPVSKVEEVDIFDEPIVNSSLGMVGAVALEELMTDDDQVVLADLAEEEDSQIPAANNDPDQEKLLNE